MNRFRVVKMMMTLMIQMACMTTACDVITFECVTGFGTVASFL